MSIQGINLAWITVKDLDSAVEFYTSIGLTLKEKNSEWGWAELSGPEGSVLGIAQESPNTDITSGTNAIVTITVKDLDVSLKEFLNKGAKLIGDVIEVPGHVKMQTFADKDGNTLQIIQMLD